MSWHYQLMKHKDGSIALHEYYVSEEGEDMWTEKPVQIIEKNVKDIKKALKRIRRDIERHGVIEYD